MKFIMEWITDWNTGGTMWIWFIPAAIMTFIFSWEMVKYAEGVIAKTKFGGAFVGGVLVSAATSIPELVTEVTQAAAGQPAIGMADDIGANAFSSVMIAIVALFMIKSMFIKKLHTWSKILILISFITSILMTIFLAVNKDVNIGSAKYAIGLVPIVFLIIYIIVTILSYKYGDEDEKYIEEPDEIPNTSLTKNNEETLHDSKTEACEGHSGELTAKKAIFGFAGFAILTMIMALVLNWVVGAMQITYNISEKSAGGLLLSMTTALPEIVALVKFALDKQAIAAIGSILGSHIFNYSLVFYGDLAYGKTPIMEAEGVQAVWAIAAIVSVSLFFLGLMVLFSKKIKTKAQYAILPSFMVLTYVVGWILILVCQ